MGDAGPEPAALNPSGALSRSGLLCQADIKRQRQQGYDDGRQAGVAPGSQVHLGVQGRAGCVQQIRDRSLAAICAGRLSYLAAAIACQSLDYVSVSAPFRSPQERRELVLNAVRYGALDQSGGLKRLRVAIELVRKYAPGPAASSVELGLKRDLDAIPAEIIADQTVRMLRDGQLFSVGRVLEAAAYRHVCPPFDDLPAQAKALLGSFLDFAAVRRDAFAASWKGYDVSGGGEISIVEGEGGTSEGGQSTLFDI